MVNNPDQFLGSMGYGNIIVFAFGTLLCKISRELIIPNADKFCRIKQRIAEVTGTTLFHVRKAFDGNMKALEPMNVIYQTAEDGLADTVKPRLELAGADCERIMVIDESDKSLSMIDERLEEALVTTGASRSNQNGVSYHQKGRSVRKEAVYSKR